MGGEGRGESGYRLVMEASQRSWLRPELLFWIEGKPWSEMIRLTFSKDSPAHCAENRSR